MSKVVDFERNRSKKESTSIDLPEFFNEVLSTKQSTSIDLSESFLMDEEIFVQEFTKLNDYVDSLNIEKHKQEELRSRIVDMIKITSVESFDTGFCTGTEFRINGGM